MVIPFHGALVHAHPLYCDLSSASGSGITLYIVQVNFSAINVSITVDSLQPAYRSYPEAGYVHNVSLFDVQELPSGPHTVNVALLNYVYSSDDAYAYGNGTSALVFDFAVVNEAIVAGTSTPSTAAPAPTQTSPSSTSKSSPLDAIIGGAVGGVVLIIAAIVIYLCRHRIAASYPRRRRTEIDPEPSHVTDALLQDYGPSPLTSPGYVVTGFDAATAYQPISHPSLNSSQRPNPHPGPPRAGDMLEVGYASSSSGARSSGNSRGLGSESGLTPATEMAYARFSGGSGVPGQAPSMGPLGLHSAGTSSLPHSSASQSAVSRALSDIPSLDATHASHLTPEQLDFVSNLISLNVPAADIAGVMQRMREEGAGGEANRRMGLGAERGVLGSGDMKKPPTDEELPQYEPRS
ncbi:hypothetical protein HWV62_29234 [Athelia sp. TMB]|nr:hypothetical protein HWV62_29234 [Athelia sp. TMB]